MLIIQMFEMLFILILILILILYLYSYILFVLLQSLLSFLGYPFLTAVPPLQNEYTIIILV